ncbi:MAG: hypothetical protein KatS3mg008_1830 [Acidimicrobiales bacterium]|nr:MAG: hypothetical protein KatS3mg008_1830 [Acidimicrobiales bacterium]
MYRWSAASDRVLRTVRIRRSAPVTEGSPSKPPSRRLAGRVTPNLVTSLVHRRRRARVLTWLAASAVASIVTWQTVEGAARDARRLVALFGHPERVPVADRDIGPGEVLRSEDVRWELRPTTSGPPAASRPVGRTTRDRLLAGETIAEPRLVPSPPPPGHDHSGGRLTIAVPLQLPVPDVSAGDRVDLMGIKSEGTPATVLADDARVVSAGEDELIVAVAAWEVSPVVRAIVEGPVVVVLESGRDARPERRGG